MIKSGLVQEAEFQYLITGITNLQIFVKLTMNVLFLKTIVLKYLRR